MTSGINNVTGFPSKFGFEGYTGGNVGLGEPDYEEMLRKKKAKKEYDDYMVQRALGDDWKRDSEARNAILEAERRAEGLRNAADFSRTTKKGTWVPPTHDFSLAYKPLDDRLNKAMNSLKEKK